MDFLTANGIDLVILIQGLGDWLVAPMRFFTFLGSEDFFFLILPAIYWCIDSALGLRIGYILIISNGLSFIFKLAFAGPRPYWINPQVQALTYESSFGVPSGHAQNAVSIWGLMAHRIGKSWAYALGFGIALLIGFSRLVLGMHFPHDVLAGWLIGGVLLWTFARLWHPVSAWLGRQTFARQGGGRHPDFVPRNTLVDERDQHEPEYDHDVRPHPRGRSLPRHVPDDGEHNREPGRRGVDRAHGRISGIRSGLEAPPSIWSRPDRHPHPVVWPGPGFSARGRSDFVRAALYPLCAGRSVGNGRRAMVVFSC